EVMADARDVVGQATARLEIRGIGGKRIADRAGPRTRNVLAACEPPRPILRLPEGQDMLAIRILMVIGDGESLRPIPAVTIGDAHHPRARALVAAIRERNARRDGGELVWFLAHRQCETGGAGFEFGGAGSACHVGLVSRKCPRHGNRGPWSLGDTHGAKSAI